MDECATLLIIEDNDSLRLLLRTIMEDTYRVTAKKDGLDGLAWLSLGNIPDLILLDIHMPNLGGLELMTHLRSNGFYRHIPIIVLSGESNQTTRQQCMQLGAKDYFTKPFEPQNLMQALQTVLTQAV